MHLYPHRYVCCMPNPHIVPKTQPVGLRAFIGMIVVLRRLRYEPLFTSPTRQVKKSGVTLSLVLPLVQNLTMLSTISRSVAKRVGQFKLTSTPNMMVRPMAGTAESRTSAVSYKSLLPLAQESSGSIESCLSTIFWFLDAAWSS